MSFALHVVFFLEFSPGERETDRQLETEIERDRQTETVRERERDSQTDLEREGERERETNNKACIQPSSTSPIYSRFLADEVALDTTGGVIPVEAERLEQFGAVLGMVVIIGLSRRPVREIHIVLCGLPEIMALLDRIG